YSVLGDPDIMLLSLSELSEQVRRITRAADIALFVDADHGFGNALNARHTIAELDSAGAAGVSLEDTALPLAFGGATGTGLIALDEAVGKLRAAMAGKRHADFVVAGRTKFSGSLEELQQRVAAYSSTGVDAIFLTKISTRAALEAARASSSLPFILGSASGEIDHPDYLAGQGVKVCLRGHETFVAAMAGAYAALHRARHGVEPAPRSGAALMRHFTRADAFDGDAERYLGIPPRGK
ncbi:MAG TPA: isocitrate lyase/PEP mutase family protein, partial [Devosia sp.]|nr:isocitrate lyase/PEP mutase family protein [Devosia sp.]